MYRSACVLFMVGFLLIPSAITQEQITSSKPCAATVPVQRTARWWLLRHQEKLANIKEGLVDFLMLGDSITHSWEGPGKAVWDRYYKHRKALNIGFSGDRTEHLLWRLQNGEIDNLAPKLAVVMIGTNNTGHNMNPAEQTARGIQAILSELKKRLPGTRILLLAVFPRAAADHNPMRKRNNQINRLISRFADDKKVFYLDINHHFLNEKKELAKEIMPDFLHLNGRGYRIWAEAMEPTLSRLLGDKAVKPERAAEPKGEKG